ncbi:MAG: histidine triad nucleotide-binding protein [Coriobacteriia bacterium]
MSDCIFCMVAAGEIPAKTVYENELIIAFDDIAPQGPVHTLIIPRQHYANLGDNVPADVLSALLGVVPEVAAIKGLTKQGYRVIINNGPDARQSVGHLHLHVIGGRPMSHGMVRFADDE